METEQAKLLYKLPVFEGPLDLLLTLITKNKIDIYDIQIAELLEQYMKQVDLMKEQSLDIESEFLEMASRLVYIKSVSLLPKHEEEAQQLKEELTGQLIEYQLCRETAKKMAPMLSFDTFERTPSPVEYDLTYNRIHESEVIAKAFLSAVGRGKKRLPPSEQAFSGIVSHKIISVSSKIINVMRRLRMKNSIKYSELFEDGKERSELVATFLAVLELVKGKRIRVEGDGDNASVQMIQPKA